MGGGGGGDNDYDVHGVEDGYGGDRVEYRENSDNGGASVGRTDDSGGVVVMITITGSTMMAVFALVVVLPYDAGRF